MNTVDRIKEECKSQRIPISRLEKDLGFANGYIAGLRKGYVPSDRLEKIAEYLKVPSNYLLTGEEPNATIEGSYSDIMKLIHTDTIIGDNDDVLFIIETVSKWSQEQKKKT